MQVGFKVWQDTLEGKDKSELYYSFYIFFMLASCTIVLKVILYIFYFNITIETKFIFIFEKII